MWAPLKDDIFNHIFKERQFSMLTVSCFDIFDNLSCEAKQIFSLIQKRGPLTKNSIALLTKMKLTTLNRIMACLEEKQLIVPSGTEKSTGGRKPVVYDVNPKKYYVIGIDISRTYFSVVFANLKMNIKNRWLCAMNEKYTPEKTVEVIVKWIYDLINECSLRNYFVLGAGLGAVGPLDRQKGVILNAENFPSEGWANIPIKQMFEKKLELPVVIDNGANMAVLGEYLFGHGKSQKNVAYFNIGVGIRTGVISSGTIIRTINDFDDSFAHMVVDVDGKLCKCGNKGCLECYCTIPSIMQNFFSALKEVKISALLKEKHIENIEYTDICIAAEQNDPLAKKVIINAAEILGTGLSNYINLFSPNIIILSGPLIFHSRLFYSTSVQTALKKSYIAKHSKLKFSRGGVYNNYSMAVGAAAMFIEYLLNN